MGYFQVRYDSRVVIYERKMFIRLATEQWRRFGGLRLDCLSEFNHGWAPKLKLSQVGELIVH